MRILIACESSGIVRNAFRALGHDAWSCDLLPADDGHPCHIQGDARETILNGLEGQAWDMVIGHAPWPFNGAESPIYPCPCNVNRCYLTPFPS